jgi:hypothetical protein
MEFRVPPRGMGEVAEVGAGVDVAGAAAAMDVE